MTLRKRAILILSIFGAGFALAASRLPLKLPPVCMFRNITGLPCCGCGMTHAFCAMANGQFHDAVNFNLAAIPLAVVVAVAGLLLLGEAIDNKPRLDPAWQKTKRFILWTGGPILLLSWILNLGKVFLH